MEGDVEVDEAVAAEAREVMMGRVDPLVAVVVVDEEEGSERV